MIHAYIDGVLFITKNDFKYHLKALHRLLQRLAELGLEVNAERPIFGRTETEYLGFWVRNKGVRPLSSKLKAIKAIDVPTNVCDI